MWAAIGYPPTTIGYPPTAIGYPPTAIGYPPTAIGYPPTAIGYPPTAIGYPPTAIGYPPTAIGYPPTAIVRHIGHFITAPPGCHPLVCWEGTYHSMWAAVKRSLTTCRIKAFTQWKGVGFWRPSLTAADRLSPRGGADTTPSLCRTTTDNARPNHFATPDVGSDTVTWHQKCAAMPNESRRTAAKPMPCCNEALSGTKVTGGCKSRRSQ